MGRTLTARQQRVYDFIHDKISNRGYGPTVREIGEFLGIKSPNGVICHLRALERKGMIARTANKSRSIELKNRSSGATSSVLSMHGKVDSGSCNLFDAPQTLDFLNALQHPERFLLQYNGDNLHDWAILDGDILVVEQKGSSASGQIQLVRDPSGKLLLRHSEQTEEPAESMVVVGIIRALPSMNEAVAKTTVGTGTDRALSAHAAHAVGQMHIAPKSDMASSAPPSGPRLLPTDLPQPAGAR